MRVILPPSIRPYSMAGDALIDGTSDLKALMGETAHTRYWLAKESDINYDHTCED